MKSIKILNCKLTDGFSEVFNKFLSEVEKKTISR